LHIAQGVAPALDWDLNKIQVAYNVVKNQRIIEISTRPISIFSIPVEVEITVDGENPST
jgi:hypothetical protein